MDRTQQVCHPFVLTIYQLHIYNLAWVIGCLYEMQANGQDVQQVLDAIKKNVQVFMQLKRERDAAEKARAATNAVNRPPRSQRSSPGRQYRNAIDSRYEYDLSGAIA